MDFRGNLLVNGNTVVAAKMDSGTSYPGSPVDGQYFYRTDLDTVAVYNGAGWDVQATTDYVDTAVAAVAGALTNVPTTTSVAATAGKLVIVSNTTGSDITVTLPSGPTDGDRIGVVVAARTAAGLIVVDGNGNNFSVTMSQINLTSKGSFVILQYDVGSDLWLVIAGNVGSQRYTEDIGDGIANPVTVTHGLGTTSVSVDVIEISTGTTVLPTIIARTGIDAVDITFGVLPTTDQYRVLIRSAYV